LNIVNVQFLANVIHEIGIANKLIFSPLGGSVCLTDSWAGDLSMPRHMPSTVLAQLEWALGELSVVLRPQSEVSSGG
jgi:hypothetical protein